MNRALILLMTVVLTLLCTTLALAPGGRAGAASAEQALSLVEGGWPRAASIELSIL
jgi:hypothetical protein